MKVSSLEWEMAMLLESENITGYQTEVCLLKEIGRKNRCDFVFHDYKLVIEIEGGIHLINIKTKSGKIFKHVGRHLTAKGFTDDCEKYNELALMGWTVLRVTADHVKNGKALNWIKRFLINCELN